MSRHSDCSNRSIISPCIRALCAATCALLLAGAAGSHVRADEIYFNSGYSQTGVVVHESESVVRFKTEMGLVSVSRKKVNFIEKASDEENQAMLKKWRQKTLLQKERLEAKREAERKFEAEQIKKGLVKFEGIWMTPERHQEILRMRKQAHAHKMQFESQQIERGLVKFQHIWVTPTVERQLVDMEEDIERLVEQTEDNKETMEAYRSAMLNAGSFAEAEQFAEKVEKLGEEISENEKELELLFKKADGIEAASVRYITPEKFLEFLPQEEAFE